MELFNKYGNSEVLFLLDLFSQPQPFSSEDVKLAVRKNHAYPENWSFSFAMAKWVTMGLFEVMAEKAYQIAQNLSSFAAPPDNREFSFLQDILTTQETGLFFSSSETADIKDNNSTLFQYIHRKNLQGRESELKNLDTDVFKVLLGAIYRKETVILTGLQVPQESLVPYRLEASVLDGV
ncbi:hypothetical protein [Acutalibacter caecimuris]|uniref:hypothetical protein n=1 Tax=Acutalibacter caecimuris TaxID=3093657 RepID=UPI002AC9C685|nr:hypothetical protein [Acutalibacter sp. M00118]